MSSHLAIATVTAALKYMISTEVERDFPGINVTVDKPKAADKVKVKPTINGCIPVMQ